MVIKIDQVKGFQYLGAGVQVLKNGEMFYENEPHNGNPLTFNLPRGTYVIRLNGGSIAMREPLKYSFEVLPAPTVKRSKLKSFEPVRHFESNPNKCSVRFTDRPYFFWDQEFYNSLNSLEKTFIELHEIGHYYYSSGIENEINCDNYAINQMLKMGYNPTQIYSAFEKSLSNEHRQNVNFEKILESDKSV